MSLVNPVQLTSMFKILIILLVLPFGPLVQDDDSWPSLSYLRQDYKSVSVVAHIRIEQAEITSRVGGYENWKINAVVLRRSRAGLRKAT